MPFIQSKVNVEISESQEKKLKEELGKAISILPGKSEQWLMLGFEDNCRLYFRGDNTAPAAFVEVKIFGKTKRTAMEELTGRICSIFQDTLKISPDRIYVKYEEVENWGWNGGNF